MRPLLDRPSKNSGNSGIFSIIGDSPPQIVGYLVSDTLMRTGTNKVVRGTGFEPAQTYVTGSSSHNVFKVTPEGDAIKSAVILEIKKVDGKFSQVYVNTIEP